MITTCISHHIVIIYNDYKKDGDTFFKMTGAIISKTQKTRLYLQFKPKQLE